jgi:UDP-N-acetylglucosamine--N-acetylmuramyl-(pentapeptide) pyrophosphoryl-undecaprenol N-acetylglucosamine transferase
VEKIIMAQIIISGGGTGGHIFPAIAIAEALKAADSSTNILFVGAEGRMEMERVPAAGYKIIGLPVVGMKRGSAFKNANTLVKLLKSVKIASNIIAEFRPDVVVGVGGYASFPTLFAAQQKGIPTIIAEQNSYAGKSNKWLARRATKVCTSYNDMERFFQKHKIVLTGNPVRQDLQNLGALRGEALRYFGLDDGKKTILVVGGSLGARTINSSMLAHLADIEQNPQIQWLWQSGKLYHTACAATLAQSNIPNIKLVPFIERMDYALGASDLVISRAGAGAIAELAVVAKPCILVPSPNVAEDHQTKNARALEVKDAAVMLPDSVCGAMLIHQALKIAQDEARMQTLSHNISAFAKPNAAEDIAKIILNTLNCNRNRNSKNKNF